MKTYAIIPSGGIGKRSGVPVPKQYIQLKGKELIAFTIDTFQNCNLVDEIIIPVQKDYINLIQTIKEKYFFTKITNIVEGGEERQQSVFNALQSLHAHKDDLIVVHDAVRPLLSNEILLRAIGSAKEFGSSVVAIKAKDTLIQGNDSVISYLNRNEIYYVQTPQVFRFDILTDAMNKAIKENFLGTDESILVHRAGYKVKIVEGSSMNFKITNCDDIEIFERICDNNI